MHDLVRLPRGLANPELCRPTAGMPRLRQSEVNPSIRIDKASSGINDIWIGKHEFPLCKSTLSLETF
jgi:hypothetical protein